MEKLSLHESFRIYLPGLLFCLLSFALFSGSFSGAGEVAVPAIFIGFAINYPLRWLGTKYFGRLINTFKISIKNEKLIFLDHEHNILTTKYLMFKSSSDQDLELSERLNKNPGWDFITYCYFAKSYDSAETSFFRLPKSFGVMCFNFFIVSLVVPIIFTSLQLSAGYDFTGFHIVIIGCSMFISILFFISATQFMKDSLIKQLYYWGSLTEIDIKGMMHYYHLQKRL